MVLTKNLMLIPYFLIAVVANRCLFVKPDNFTCHEDPCETLEFYALNGSEYFTKNASFIFLPGTHIISNISISNVSNVTLASTEGNVTIQCNGSGGIVFQNASRVVLANLSFVSCGQPLPNSLQREGEMAQAALAFGQVTDLQLESVSVSHSRGFGLLGHCVHGNFSITNSYFTSNKGSSRYLGGNAAIGYMDCTSLAKESNVWISSSTFSHGGYDDTTHNCTQTNATGLQIVSNSNISVNISDVTMTNNYNNPFCGRGGNLLISIYSYRNILSNNITITNSSFIYGTARNGAGVFVYFYIPLCLKATELELPSSNILLDKTSISHNAGGGLSYEFRMSIDQDDRTNCPRTIFKVNKSLFDGNTLIRNNFQLPGNGVAVHLIAKYSNNKALKVNNENYKTSFEGCIFKNSKLKDSGTSYTKLALDAMTIKSINMDHYITDCKIKDNAFPGIGLSKSKIVAIGSIILSNNKGMNGGGMLFCESSYLILTRNTNIRLIGNHAVQRGGGIYIESGCLHSIMPFCFYQPDYREKWNCSNISTAITMINNTAGYAGHHIYGGNLDKCTFLTCNSTKLFQNLITVSLQNITAVTSNPRRVCFCNATGKPDCAKQDSSTKAAIYPGEFIEPQKMAIVGQFNGTVPGTVRYYTTQFGVGVKPEYISTSLLCESFLVQVKARKIKPVNVSIQLMINFVHSSENVTYHSPSEPLTIVVALKNCPPGFIHSNGMCECDKKLLPHTVHCNITEKTIYRDPPEWIGTINGGHHMVYHPVCPYDYCVDEKVKITSNDTFFDQDSQCAQNRTGLLCSKCVEGTTLSLGSFKCIECENKVALPITILSFMLFGLVFVLLLVTFNITYTDGTFSGLLFYANIVNLNGSVFLPRAHVNTSFRVILNWMSFNVGFDSCFYDGMDSYAKTWVTLFFPSYLMIINAVIILLCSRSEKLARLFGENIVKVLATILIVSYTSLIEFVVTALSFTVIQYSSNSTNEGTDHMTVVWTSDPTLKYFSGKHIPLALVAIVFGLLILAFTMVLLCVQPLQRYSHLRCFSWMAKLKPFIDAYTAPHIIKDNCRYWEGLLLFFRLVMTIILSANIKNVVSRDLGATTCICVMIFTIAWCVGGVYKKSYLNILNSSYILNLAVIAVVGSHTDKKNWRIGSFKPVIYVSYSVAIITAGVVLAHQVYLQARSWRVLCKKQQYVQLPAENKDDDMLANLRQFN